MLSRSPLVSVIIPTYHRPKLVLRAVGSVLKQTFCDFEIIVVVDGRDNETREALATIDDTRLCAIVPDRHLGNADARNLGVRHARASWVAFLDDDDQWMPQKLAAQLETALHSQFSHPIITCNLIARSESGDFLWPRRRPALNESLSEYFFCRRTPFTGEGIVINSAILTSRKLALSVPFRSGLDRHVDPDWILRATLFPSSGLEFVAVSEPLLIWHVERQRRRITTAPDWNASLNYALANRDLFTSRAYAAFILHVVSSNAAAQRDTNAFFVLLKEAFEHGLPAKVDVLAHCGNFLLPDTWQRWAARAFAAVARPWPSSNRPLPNLYGTD